MTNAHTGAVVQTSFQRTIVTHPTIVASTREVLAATVAGTVVGADHTLRAVSPAPAINAVACSVAAKTVTRAISDAGSLAAIVTLPARSAVAGAVAAVSMSSTIPRAGQQTAVKPSEPSIAAASKVLANTVVGTMVGAYARRAIVASIPGEASASTLLTETVVGTSVGAISCATVQPTEPREASTSSVKASTVLTAVIGALACRAVDSLVALHTLALTIHTRTPTRALVRAKLGFTASTRVSGVTNADSVRCACSVAVASIWTIGLLTSNASPALIALAITVRVSAACAAV